MNKQDSNKNLTDLNFLMDVLRKQSINDVLSEFNNTTLMKTNKKLSNFHNFIKSGLHLFKKGDKETQSDKILFQIAYEHSGDSYVNQQAEELVINNKVDWPWLKQKNRKNKLSFNPNILTLEGHTSWIRGTHLVLKNKFLLTWAEDKTLRLWNLKDGSVKFLNGHKHTIYNVILIGEGKALSWNDTEIFLWNLKSGEFIVPDEYHKFIKKSKRKELSKINKKDNRNRENIRQRHNLCNVKLIEKNKLLFYTYSAIFLWDIRLNLFRILSPDFSNEFKGEIDKRIKHHQDAYNSGLSLSKKIKDIIKKQVEKEYGISNSSPDWGMDILYDTPQLGIPSAKIVDVKYVRRKIIACYDMSIIRIWDLKNMQNNSDLVIHKYSIFKKYYANEEDMWVEVGAAGLLGGILLNNLNICTNYQLLGDEMISWSQEDSCVCMCNLKQEIRGVTTSIGGGKKDYQIKRDNMNPNYIYANAKDMINYSAFNVGKAHWLQNFQEDLKSNGGLATPVKIGDGKYLTVLTEEIKGNEGLPLERCKREIFFLWGFKKVGKERVITLFQRMESPVFYDLQSYTHRATYLASKHHKNYPGHHVFNKESFLFWTRKNLCSLDLRTSEVRFLQNADFTDSEDFVGEATTKKREFFSYWDNFRKKYKTDFQIHMEMIREIKPINQEKVVFAAGRNLYLWDIKTNEYQIFKGHDGNIMEICLVNDNKVVTICGDGRHGIKRSLIIWNLKDGSCKILEGHIDNLIFNMADRSKVYYVDGVPHKEANRYDVPNHKQIIKISDNTIFTFDKKTIRLWDISLNKYQTNHDIQQEEEIVSNLSLVLDDNIYIYQDERNNFLRMVDTKTNTHKDIVGFPRLKKLSKVDNSNILTLSEVDVEVKMLNINSKKEIIITKHEDVINGIELLFNNTSVISWSADGVIKLSNIKNRECQMMYVFENLKKVEKLNNTNFIAISTNGSYKLLELENPSKIE